MTTVKIKLKKVGPAEYALFGPKGNKLSGVYHGDRHSAITWAKTWASSWYNWDVDYEEIDNEKTSGVPESPV